MLEKTDLDKPRFAPAFAPLVPQPRGSLDVAERTDASRVWAIGRFLSLNQLSFLLVVFLPTYCAGFDSLVLASNRYVSEFRVAVRSLERQKTGGLGDLLGFAGVSPTGDDSYAVVQYVQSRQAIADLGGARAVAKLFDGEAVDWFSRLDAHASIEALTRYWNRMVEAVYENSTGTIIVRVATFEPEESRRVATALLKNAEGLVNKMSDRAHRDSLDFAVGQLRDAQARLDGVREKIRRLQDSEAMLDPSKSAETTLAIAAKLKEQVAQLSAELIAQRARLSETAPSVMGARTTLMGLQRELAHVEAEATRAPGKTLELGKTLEPGKTLELGKSSDRPLSSVLGSFQQLADDKAFAEKAYLSALSALETARMEAARQQIYLATIVPPDLAEEPSFPRPLRQILTVFGVTASLWLIGRLGVHAVREHA